jgi:predicted nucleotide-binding protein
LSETESLTDAERELLLEAAPKPDRWSTHRLEPLENKRRAKERRIARKSRRRVFVVHGRNRTALDAMHKFLAALGLEPLYFDEARGLTRDPMPFTLDVVKKGLSVTQATLVLMTMEDVGCLREQFRAKDELSHETQFVPKPRQNVIFEAGMAMALRPKATVLVELGKHHHTISDLAGKHMIRMDNSLQKRELLVTSLKNAGCRAKQSGEEWKTKEKGGDFEAAVGTDGFSGELKKLLSDELERLRKESDRVVKIADLLKEEETTNKEPEHIPPKKTDLERQKKVAEVGPPPYASIIAEYVERADNLHNVRIHTSRIRKYLEGIFIDGYYISGDGRPVRYEAQLDAEARRILRFRKV